MARDNGSAAEALDSTDYTDGTDDTGDTGRDGRSRVQWPTVAMSVGLSTLAAAVVIGVGSAVMIAHSDNGDPVVVREAADSVTTHGKSWPTTSASASKKPSSPAKPSAGAKPDTKQDAAAGKSDHGSHGGGVVTPVDDPSTGGGHDGGDAAARGGDNGGDAGDTAVPPQPSAAELQNQLESMLAPGASDDQIAANLASPAGASSIKAAGAQMRAFPIFHFQVDEPITVDGDEMTATINMSMTGLGTKPPQNLYYQVRDGRWVLTDESVCLIAQQARVDCSV
jgi:hypothetical protein